MFISIPGDGGKMRNRKTSRMQLRIIAKIPTLLGLLVVLFVVKELLTSQASLITSQRLPDIELDRAYSQVPPSSNRSERDVQIEGRHKSDVSESGLLASKGYTAPGCSCVRFGFSLESVIQAQQKAKQQPTIQNSFLKRYNFSGQSTCSDYSTQRGARQNVVSYSYYTPEGRVDPESQHFKKYLGQLYGRAATIRESYPGWIMRIYHNVTDDDEQGNKFLCRIFCAHKHVDLCHVKKLPVIGNLEKLNVVGRLWRFAVMGDPTVDKFLIRDSDSWVLDREVAAVREWLSSNTSFHVIRDHPNHKAVMLAGLWGGMNNNASLMEKIQNEIFSQPLNQTFRFDQYMLATRVWPNIKNDVLQHDSYNCNMESHQGSRPFPVRRLDGLYCGWGPFKYRERKKVFETNCPEECRPESNKKWTHC